MLQENGPLYLALDANFGLVQKSNSGQSVCGPVLAQRVFYDQHLVDDYIQNYSQETKMGEQVSFIGNHYHNHCHAIRHVIVITMK